MGDDVRVLCKRVRSAMQTKVRTTKSTVCKKRRKRCGLNINVPKMYMLTWSIDKREVRLRLTKV